MRTAKELPIQLGSQIIIIQCVFKPLTFGVVCYTAIANWSSHWEWDWRKMRQLDEGIEEKEKMQKHILTYVFGCQNESNDDGMGVDGK